MMTVTTTMLLTMIVTVMVNGYYNDVDDDGHDVVDKINDDKTVLQD